MGKSLINKNIPSSFLLDIPYHYSTTFSVGGQHLLFSKCCNEWDNIILHMYYLYGGMHESCTRKIILPKNTEVITTLTIGQYSSSNIYRKNFIKFFRDEQGNIYYTLFPGYLSSNHSRVANFYILGGYNN